MAAQNQKFEAFQGRDCAPVFTVTDDDDVAINLSTVQDIGFAARRTLGDDPILSKSLIEGSIALLNGGTGGKFQVSITAADTAALSAFYFFEAWIVDSTGVQTTVAIGRMQVGAAPIWTYSGNPATSNRDALRYLIGDIVESDPLIQDPELDFALTQRTSIYGAAALACRSLASKLSREADTVDKDLRDSISQRARAFRMMAVDYETQASVRSGAMPYAGGISKSDKAIQVANTDRVEPQYTLGMDDNLIDPEAPVGGETLP